MDPTAEHQYVITLTCPDTTGIVVDRLVDSLIGGAIALGAYLLWPTWSERDAEQSLAHLAEAQREYAGAAAYQRADRMQRRRQVGVLLRRRRRRRGRRWRR